MIEYEFYPQGVCSKKIVVLLDDDNVIQDLEFVGGCNGNAKAIAKLVCGQPAMDIALKFEGIKCGGKESSCAAQLSEALKTAIVNNFPNVFISANNRKKGILNE